MKMKEAPRKQAPSPKAPPPPAPKARTEAMPPPHSLSEDAGARPPISRKPAEGISSGVNMELDPRRKMLLDKFHANQGNPGTSEPADSPPEHSAAPSDNGDTDTPSDQEGLLLDPVAAAEEGPLPLLPGESQPEDPDVTPAPGDKTKDQKLVPLGALHEEREKHKQSKQRLQSLEVENSKLTSQLSEVLKDFKQTLDANKGKPATPNGQKDPAAVPEPIDDIEGEIRRLRSENAELRTQWEDFRTTRKDDEQKAIDAERQRMLSDTHHALEKEGFPGFDQFVDAVGAKLVAIHRVNPELAKKLDNPMGWKRIYKEKVYPEKSRIFLKKQKEQEVAGKVDLKKRASLSGSPGQPPASAPEQKKEWTYSEYLQHRRKTGVA